MRPSIHYPVALLGNGVIDMGSDARLAVLRAEYIQTDIGPGEARTGVVAVRDLRDVHVKSLMA